MGGATMYCVLCGYPADSSYAEENLYAEDTSHLNDIVVFLRDGTFSAVGWTEADDGFGNVRFPDGAYICSIAEGLGYMMHKECSLVLQDMMGSNGISIYNWLCNNVSVNNNTIDGYCYEEYKYGCRNTQFWSEIFPFAEDEEEEEEEEEDKERARERKTVIKTLFYASPNIDGFVYNQSVINTVSEEQPSVVNLIIDLAMFDMFIDYKDAIALAGTSKQMRGQIARDNRYWKRVHNYRKLKFDEDLNFDQMVQKLHSPNVMKRSRLQYTVQYILDRCTVKRQKLH